jgi:hypothetical protein
MKIKFILIIALSATALSGKANQGIYNYVSTSGEDSIRFNRNGIYPEVYLIRHDFSSGFVSFNYERRLGKKNNMMLRLGIYPDLKTTISFPLTYTFISPASGCHHLSMAWFGRTH